MTMAAFPGQTDDQKVFTRVFDAVPKKALSDA